MSYHQRSVLRRAAGWLLVGSGVLTMFVVVITGYGSALPGRLGSWYFGVGIAAAGAGMWSLGLFDTDA